MGVEEVDNADATLIDAYMIALEEVTSQGGGSKKENDEIARAFMG